jgi:hypothetical protein
VNDPNLEEGQTNPNAAAAAAASSPSTGTVTPSLLEQNAHLVSPKGKKTQTSVFFFFPHFFHIENLAKFNPPKKKKESNLH